MKAVVQNFRGISEAHIAISPIALITGRNGAGKTSIARAVAAAVTGKAVPYDKVTKKDCAVMLRNGSALGSVTVSTEDGSTTVEWPKAEAQSDGRPPIASPIAAGLTDVFTMKDKDALAYLINLLGANVKLVDFIGGFEAKGIPTATAEAVWATVDAQGWEAAHLRAKDTGTKLKGAWEHATGDKYGSKKAAEWIPAGWDDALAAETVESLQSAVDDARTTLEQAISQNAVGQAERQALKVQADSIPTLETQKKDAEVFLAALEVDLKRIETELRANPSPDAKGEHPCPHCQGKIHIKAVSGTEYILSKAAPVSEIDLKEARAKNASLCGNQQKVSRMAQDARTKLGAISSDVQAASRAKQKLEQLGDAPEGNPEEVQAKRDSLSTAERRLKTFESHRDAKKTAAKIADNQVIIDLLDETGMRQSKLAECLFSFQNSYMDPLCEAFGIAPVTLRTDLSASLGKTMYPMLSASEQFRVRTVLQVAIAQRENADLVIIDGADILDQPSRGKLLQVVLKAGLPAIVCMTLPNADKAPDLAAAGVGVTYWVENGTCKPVEAKAPKPAAEQIAASVNQQPGFFTGMREKAQKGAAA